MNNFNRVYIFKVPIVINTAKNEIINNNFEKRYLNL